MVRRSRRFAALHSLKDHATTKSSPQSKFMEGNGRWPPHYLPGEKPDPPTRIYPLRSRFRQISEGGGPMSRTTQDPHNSQASPNIAMLQSHSNPELSTYHSSFNDNCDLNSDHQSNGASSESWRWNFTELQHELQHVNRDVKKTMKRKRREERWRYKAGRSAVDNATSNENTINSKKGKEAAKGVKWVNVMGGSGQGSKRQSKFVGLEWNQIESQPGGESNDDNGGYGHTGQLWFIDSRGDWSANGPASRDGRSDEQTDVDMDRNMDVDMDMNFIQFRLNQTALGA